MGWAQAIFADGTVLTFGDMPDDGYRPAAVSGLRSNEDCPAFRRACELIDARARSTTFREIKFLARRYRERPSTLNGLYPGLAGFSSTDLIRHARSALGVEGRQIISGADMIANVRASNLRAAWVLGRYWRRFSARLYGFAA